MRSNRVSGESGRGAAGERNHLMLSEVEAVALAILLTLAVNVPSAHAVDLDAPVTSIETAIDQYHGVTVADPYRWLEKGEDQRVRDWSIAEDKRTRAYLNGLTVRKPIYDRLMNLTSQTSPSYSSRTVNDTKLRCSLVILAWCGPPFYGGAGMCGRRACNSASRGYRWSGRWC